MKTPSTNAFTLRAAVSLAYCLVLMGSVSSANALARSYPIVHTGVTAAYDHQGSINLPGKDSPYFGQDANHLNNPTAYWKARTTETLLFFRSLSKANW